LQNEFLNINMTFIAALWAAALMWALVSGQAIWLQRKVERAKQPWRYWLSVGICALMTVLFLSIGPVR
jgi:hypothetical protein